MKGVPKVKKQMLRQEHGSETSVLLNNYTEQPADDIERFHLHQHSSALKFEYHHLPCNDIPPDDTDSYIKVIFRAALSQNKDLWGSKKKIYNSVIFPSVPGPMSSWWQE